MCGLLVEFQFVRLGDGVAFNRSILIDSQRDRNFRLEVHQRTCWIQESRRNPRSGGYFLSQACATGFASAKWEPSSRHWQSQWHTRHPASRLHS